MSAARRMYPFAAVVLTFALAGGPTATEAQDSGLTCGWCVADEGELHIFDEQGDYVGEFVLYRHKFPGGGNECGWDGHDEPGAGCARCGGSSHCHDDWWGGMCHIPCGPAGDAYSVAAEVEDALERGDVAAVALALHNPQEGVSLDFIPAAGRIEVILPCDPNSAFHTISVPPVARIRLQAAVDAAAPTE